MAWFQKIASHPDPLPASGERGRQALVASAFSPLAGRWCRQPDEGQRRLTFQRLFLVLTLLFTPIQAFAVNPDEVLADPALEQRARALSAELRCMVCQNQSIDDSNAELARDLRVVVRERLVGGDSDEQVLDYVVSRYGEFVLLKPRLSMRTIALWGAPAALAIIGLIVAVVYTRRRSVPPVAKLSPEEEARLGKLLDRE